LNAVDLYNSVTGTWSTAQLSVARAQLAATSVGNMALFAGGVVTGGILLPQGWGASGGQCRWLHARSMFACVALVGRYGLPPHVSTCRHRIFPCRGLVQQCDRDVVDGSAERGTRSACSRVGWVHGAVRWRLDAKFVVAPRWRVCAFLSCGVCDFLCQPLQVQCLMPWTCTTV
jgi:hypothetical protein